MTDRPDLVVVGGGPAGMAAAATALAGGLRVVLVDAGPALGGQFWRHPPAGSAASLDGADLHHDLRTYADLTGALDAAVATGRLELLLRHHVWTVERRDDGLRVHAVDRTGPAERALTRDAGRLVIATGAHDRQVPFPGWDLPGVMTAGGLQALLKGSGVRAGSRIVVGGTGPFLLPVATGLAGRGATVVTVCEANGLGGWVREARTVAGHPAKWVEGAGYAAALARRRVPVRAHTAVVAAHGTDRVEAVSIARLDGSGRVRPGSVRQVAVDAVGVGWGFVPQLELATTLGCRLASWPDGNDVVAVDDWQRTDVTGVYVAGESCGVGGATLAVREGALAGAAVVRDAGQGVADHPEVRATRRLRREIARLRAFAAAMARAHPVPAAWPTWLTDDTVVCRCEEVTAGAVRVAVAAGATDARQVKQLSRAGMGWCQGRICGFAAQCLAGEGTPGPAAERHRAVERLVAGPVTLGALADGDRSPTSSAM